MDKFYKGISIFNNPSQSFICYSQSPYLKKLSLYLKDEMGWSVLQSLPTSYLENFSYLFDFSSDSFDYFEKDILRKIQPETVFVSVPENCERRQLNNMLFQFENCGYRVSASNSLIYFFIKIDKKKLDTSLFEYYLSDPYIKHSLRFSKRKLRKLSSGTKADEVNDVARNLLVAERFDIAIKSHYARLYKLHAAKQWRERVYREHLVRITGAGRDIVEWDGSGKSGLDMFLNTFHSLLKRVDYQEVPHVPIGSEGVAIDGAHRIASAITMSRPIRSIHLNAKSQSNDTSDFFSKKNNGHPPCPSDIVDESAIEYCRIKKGLAIVLIFPTVASDLFAIQTLENNAKIVYRKKVVLTPYAGGSLLRQVYYDHEWFSKNDIEKNFIRKQRSCFPNTGVVQAILIDNFYISKLRELKDVIREHYKIGNHSVHITDSDEETLRLAKVMFNKNSIELLEMIKHRPTLKFHAKLFSYYNWVLESNINEESIAIDSGGVLSMLGLRECSDIDFLYHGSPDKLKLMPLGIECHNDLECYYKNDISSIIFDPNLHCWYMGIKFCSPMTTMLMKTERGEKKDVLDVALLRTVLPRYRWAKIELILNKILIKYSFFMASLAPLIELLKKPIRPIVYFIRKKF
jgi:hypothetical protein